MPPCPSSQVGKAGTVRGRQRWGCRGCGNQWMRTPPRGSPLWHQALAVLLYGHSRSMPTLGQMCGVRASAVLPWLRCDAADRSEKPAPCGSAIVMASGAMGHVLPNSGTRSGSGTRVIAIQAPSLTGSVGVVLRHPEHGGSSAWRTGR